MKEKLLVLAKAAPEASKTYQELICIAGITDKGEWRRVYPVPWKVFWGSSAIRFKKKQWIEYELVDDKPSDHRPESRKIKFETIRPLHEATFEEIEALLKPRVSCIEEIEKPGSKVMSLGVVEPTKIMDFIPISNQKYEELVKRKAQTDLFGNSAIGIDIPRYKYAYKFMDDEKGRTHETLCEDWEVSELYRHCEEYRKQGKYKDEAEVHEKVKQRMLRDITARGHVYFVVGSHFRFNSYMIVGVVYPKKTDMKKLAV